MRVQAKFLLVTGVASALFTALPASAQVCVDPAGGGCMTTIQAGVDVATTGQTIDVAPATYSETVQIPAGKDGLVIEASGALLDNPSSEDGIFLLSNEVTIRGLSVRNGDRGIVVGDGVLVFPSGTVLSGLSIQATVRDSVRLLGADDTLITGSRFDSCGGECLEASEGDDAGGSDRTIVSKNSFRMCSKGCVDITGDDVVVSGNKVSQSEDDPGISIEGDRALVGKNKVSLGKGGILVSGTLPVVVKNKIGRIAADAGIDVACTADCTTARVSFNKVSRTTYDAEGIDLDTDAPGMVVEKNSVSGSASEGIEASGSGITFKANKVKGSGADNFNHCFEIEGESHVVTGNSAQGCANDGFHVTGLDIEISDNTAEGNFGDGFDFDDFGDGNLAGLDVSNNTAADNIGNGFAVTTESTPAPDLALTGNSSSGNRVDLCADLLGGSLTDGGGNSFTIAGAPPCEVDHD